MTGGQMAPTTLPGMKSSTSPYGRDVKLMGYPLKMTDIVATLTGYLLRDKTERSYPRKCQKNKKSHQKSSSVPEAQ